MVNLVP
jgi:rhodanese-related sulfurtransferase